jgi:hypothetical protein
MEFTQYNFYDWKNGFLTKQIFDFFTGNPE